MAGGRARVLTVLPHPFTYGGWFRHAKIHGNTTIAEAATRSGGRHARVRHTPHSAVVCQPEKRPCPERDFSFGAFKVEVVAARQRHSLHLLEFA